MIRATIGILASSAGGFDADYQAVLDYADTQGYTLPSTSQQALQNQLVVDLKDAGVWSKLDTFAVFATDGDSDFALIDWIRLSQYTAVNSPTFTADEGFTGDGTSSYITTGYSLDSGSNFDSSTPSASFGGWSYYNKQTLANVLCGGEAFTNRVRGGACRITGSTITPATLTSGLYHMNTNSSEAILYVNGTSDATTTNSSTSDTNNFRALSDSTGFSLDTISILFSGGDLSTEQTDLYTAVNSYMTTI